MARDFEESPIIIYGAARSGTTYLTDLINAHPEVFISDETRVFVWAHRIIHDLLHDEASFCRMQADFRDHLQLELPALIRAFYSKLHPECRYWGDKNPHYASPANEGCLETILKLFPGARFINIIRDGRDVVCSAMRTTWKDLDKANRMWTSHLNRGCTFRKRLPVDRYMELRYESLVRDDVGMASQIFAFLQLDLHQNVVDYCRRQRQRRMPLSSPTRNIVADVTRSAWSHYMYPDEQLRSLEFLGADLVQFGYESETSFRQAYRHAAGQIVTQLLRPVQFEVARSTPKGATILVVNKGDEALLRLDARRAWHFPRSDDGQYAGFYPADSAAAISHLETQRALGADFLVFPRPQLWWLQHYRAFTMHLETNYRVVGRRATTCLIYDLRTHTSTGIVRS
jgi:hypothetical protein